jgi:hypothetical protein
MKHKILFLLGAAVAIAATSCLKSSSSYTGPSAPGTGTYTGTFRSLHRKDYNSPFDTLKATIVLNLNSTSGAFAVTGDTTTLHAGSHGTYLTNSGLIQFSDLTATTSNKSTKVHLNGVYQYATDGQSLQISASTTYDTLRYQYTLARTN